MAPPQRTPMQPTLRCFETIVRRLGVSATPAPHLVGLGLLTAIMEAIAVGLVVSLLFALLAEPPQGGLMGRLTTAAAALTGGGWVGLALLLITVVAAKAALTQLYAMLSIRFKNRLNARILAAAHAKLTEMRYTQLRAWGQGELINTAASETWQVANAAYLLSRLAVNACIIGVFAIIVVALSWQVAAAAVLGGGILALAGHWIAHGARRIGARIRTDIEAVYIRLLAAVQGARLIRAFALEEAERKRAAGAVEQLRRDLDSAEELQSLSGPVNEVGYVALLIGVVGLAAWLRIPQAETFTAVALLYRMAPQIRELDGARIKFASLYASLSAVAGLLASESETHAQAAAPQTRPQGAIRFEGVSFTPPGATAPALDQAGFEIPQGRVTALLGPSGAGKTTIVNLLLRLHEPDSGAISIGERALSSIPRDSWLASVAAAGQDMEVIEATVAENIRMGAPVASDAELRAAARDASALDFIELLPQGFDTWIGSFGYNLSAGQRQRISLARALLRRPALLLLDETTSAVESALEADILANVMRRCEGATIVLITHRLNRSARIDHVVRLEQGRVVAEHEWAPAHALEPSAEERRA